MQRFKLTTLYNLHENLNKAAAPSSDRQNNIALALYKQIGYWQQILRKNTTASLSKNTKTEGSPS